VSRVVIASNQKANWVFTVVRTAHDYDRDDLKRRLKVGAEVKAGDKVYQLVNKQFDSLGNLLFKGCKPCDTFAVHFVDARTLILADEPPLKQYLEGKKDEKRDEKKDAESYTTIADEQLRNILTKIEGDKEQPLLAVAGETSCLVNALTRHRDAALKQFKSKLPLPEGTPLPELDATFAEAEKNIRAEIAGFGLGLVQLKEDRLVLNLALAARSSDTADTWSKTITAMTGLGAAPPVVPPPMGMGSGQPKPADPLTITSAGKLLVIAVDSKIAQADFNIIVKDIFGKETSLWKAEAELAYTGPRHHQLAAALKKYVEARGQFPRGTLEPKSVEGKPPIGDRGKRLGWTVDLLKFLPEALDKDGNPIGSPYDKVEDKLQKEKAWNEDENLKVAEMVVPHFVVRSQGTAGFKSTNPLARRDVGAGHWVAIAGVGLDAARYPSGDKRAGIFGYDRVTKKVEIPEERRDKVIALIQVPADKVAPWIAGGGATVRGVTDGVSEGEKDNPLEPFLSEFDVRKGDKVEKVRGTYAIMADGRVRFISEKVDPTLFRSMCQLHGESRIDGFDQKVPLVKDEELEAAVPVAPPEKPKSDPPKTDPPKTDPPKTDTPKTDTPKTDTPKGDMPKNPKVPKGPSGG